MAQPNKQQWDKVKAQLSNRYGNAYLKCDDYLVSVQIEQVKMRLMVSIYINGWFRGTDVWHGKESELNQMGDISRRFYCITSKGPSAKAIATNLKIFGKKICQEKGYNDRRCYTWPQFRTPGAMISHLKKHNPNIEILDYEDYKKAIKALPEEVLDMMPKEATDAA